MLAPVIHAILRIRILDIDIANKLPLLKNKQNLKR